MKEKIMNLIVAITQHYNHEKYWRMRNCLVNKKGTKLKRIWFLYRIKRMDAFNGASFGTHLDKSAQFAGIPNLPHGIKGIIISHNAKIGRNATIFHQVTIGEGNNGAPSIGNNVFIGAGAKIIGGITIGDNVKIGANCVVCEDIPDNSTVVLGKSRVLLRN